MPLNLECDLTNLRNIIEADMLHNCAFLEKEYANHKVSSNLGMSFIDWVKSYSYIKKADLKFIEECYK